MLKGLWTVEGFDILKRRKKLLLKIKLKREVEVEDKPKTVIELNWQENKLVATAFKGKKVLNSKTFRMKNKIADEIVEYAKKFKKPVIVSKFDIPNLTVKSALNGINVVDSYPISKGLRIKPIIAGLITLIALALMAMVYYSSFGITTITVVKKVDVSVNINEKVIVYAPRMGTKEIGYIRTTVYNGSANYRLIIQLANLETHCGCEVIAVQIYDGDKLKGIITPLTPSLIIEDCESKIYTVKIFYFALKPCCIKIALQASVELI